MAVGLQCHFDPRRQRHVEIKPRITDAGYKQNFIEGPRVEVDVNAALLPRHPVGIGFRAPATIRPLCGQGKRRAPFAAVEIELEPFEHCGLARHLIVEDEPTVRNAQPFQSPDGRVGARRAVKRIAQGFAQPPHDILLGHCRCGHRRSPRVLTLRRGRRRARQNDRRDPGRHSNRAILKDRQANFDIHDFEAARRDLPKEQRQRIDRGRSLGRGNDRAPVRSLQRETGNGQARAVVAVFQGHRADLDEVIGPQSLRHGTGEGLAQPGQLDRSLSNTVDDIGRPYGRQETEGRDHGNANGNPATPMMVGLADPNARGIRRWSGEPRPQTAPEAILVLRPIVQ